MGESQNINSKRVKTECENIKSKGLVSVWKKDYTNEICKAILFLCTIL